MRHVQCFVAIASYGHMGRAAEALGISQPAISKTLAELEDMLGAVLFLRSRRGVELTREGRTLLGYAGSSLRTLREGLDHVSAIAQPETTPIAIGVLPTVAPSVAPAAVRAFREKWPATRLSVHVGVNADLLRRLARGELDLLLGRLAEPSEMIGVSYEHLYAEPLVVVARPGHPLAGTRRVAPEMLVRYSLVLGLPGTAIRTGIDSFLIEHGVGPVRDVIETLSDSFARAYVSATDALWFIARGVVQRDLENGTLVLVACDTRGTTASVGLTLRADAVPSRAVRALIDCVRAAASAHRGADAPT